MNKVLVTGSAGFIGSTLSKKLLTIDPCTFFLMIHIENINLLGTLFDEIRSSNYLQIAIVFGLQTL